jgi:F420-0:gamma-glutamyl ligase
MDDFYPVLESAINDLRDGDVLVITSKVAAISQGRCLKISEVLDKEKLIEEESQAMIPKASQKFGVALTIKNNTLIASAGIDESNSLDYYTLWPENPSLWAKEVCLKLKKKYGVKDLAVILSDSHCIPMRWGVVGISIGFFGMEPLRDYRNQADIFGRKLVYTQSNYVDAITAAAVGLMGEGAECTPAVLVRGWPNIKFTEQDTYQHFTILPEEDLFHPLLKAFTKNS